MVGWGQMSDMFPFICFGVYDFFIRIFFNYLKIYKKKKVFKNKNKLV